jgi:hypothetical protein
MWRQECTSRRSVERQADQLRAELLRLVRVTTTSPTSRRPTRARSATRATPERTPAPSLAMTKGHKAASRKRKPTRTVVGSSPPTSVSDKRRAPRGQ